MWSIFCPSCLSTNVIKLFDLYVCMCVYVCVCMCVCVCMFEKFYLFLFVFSFIILVSFILLTSIISLSLSLFFSFKTHSELVLYFLNYCTILLCLLLAST